MPCQQDEMYAAERFVSEGERFDSLHAVQVYVDEMRDLYPFWEKAYENVVRVLIKPETMNALSASGGFYPDENVGRISFPTTKPTLQHLIHELAHVFTTARYGRNGHGPWFARVYLELTYLVRGSEAYFELYTAFKNGGIDFNAEGLT